MRALPVSTVLALILLAGCVSGSATSGLQGGERNRISLEEIQTQPSTSAFEIVSRLRPNWLRGHSGTFRSGSGTGRNSPAVFVDGRPFGALDSLHQFGTEVLQELRFISAPDATTRFGTGDPAGIIEVVTRR